MKLVWEAPKGETIISMHVTAGGIVVATGKGIYFVPLLASE